MDTVVVVGASLAGLNAVEALRAGGFDDRVVVVGAEDHLPYDRPPLSKEVLSGDKPASDVLLRDEAGYDDLGVDWELGRRATGLDAADSKVALDNGMVVPFDGLVIATGASPRRLRGTPDLDGVHVLRTLDDCEALAADLAARPRVAVVGAGFIGSEVAATAKRRGCDVVVLEAAPVPLAHALGEEMGSAVSGLHGDHGVEVRCGVGVAGFTGSVRVEAVEMADGTRVDADVVVVGVGVAPETGWPADSGVRVDDGVVCDEGMVAADRVVAAGDVARWPNRLFGEVMRVEHWDNAIAQGRHAASSLLKLLAGEPPEPFAPVPWFWSDQYDSTIQFAGRPGPDVEVVSGEVGERKFAALYSRDGRITGVLAIDQPRAVAILRRRMSESTTVEQAKEALG